MLETKVHFKLYKAGKKWLVAAIGVTTLGIGLSQSINVSASDTDSTTSHTAITAVAGQTDTSNESEDPVADTPDNGDIDSEKGGSDTSQSEIDSDEDNTNGDTVKEDTTNDPSNPITDDNNTADNNADNETADNQNDDKGTPVAENTPIVSTATPASSATTYDPTQAVTDPAIVNNAAGQDIQEDTAISAHVRLTATDSAGNTTTSLTNHNSITGTSQAATFISSDAQNINALFNVTNTTDQTQNVNVTVSLPHSVDAAYNNPTQLILSNGTPASTFLADLPATLALAFQAHGDNQYYTYDDFLVAGYQLADTAKLKVTGKLAGDSSYIVNLPMSLNNPDVYTNNMFEQIGVLNAESATYRDDVLRFRIAQALPESLAGQYHAATAIKLGISYQSVPEDIQALMPELTAGQVTVHNFGAGDTTYSSQTLYTGGIIDVNLVKANIANLVKDVGYSVLLNADGTPQTNYTYLLTQTGVQMDDGADTGDGTSTNLAPYIYMTLRKVITTQDSALTVGQDWTAADNFVSGLDDADNPLSLDQVQISIDDPDNILQDGQATKAGAFKVTYAYQVADDYYNTGEPYIVAETATITVADPNQSTTTGNGTTTTPTNTGDTDTTGDNTGTSTDTSGGTTTGDTPTTGNAGDTVTTGGAGDTVAPNNTDTTTPGTDTADSPVISTGNANDTIVTGNAADKLATPKATIHNVRTTQSKRSGAENQIVTRNADTSASVQPTALVHTTPNTNTTNVQKTPSQPGQRANTTSNLPQTNETKPTGFIAAGMALLLGTLGLVTDRRKQH